MSDSADGEATVKAFFVMVLAVAAAFLFVNRERVFVRDPLATVYRDGVKQSGVQVFINYSNDVLVERDGEPGGYRTLVEGWSRMPGTPMTLRCLRWMACLTDADHATTYPMDWSGKGSYEPDVTMSNQEVAYRDGDGAAMRLVLR